MSAVWQLFGHRSKEVTWQQGRMFPSTLCCVLRARRWRLTEPNLEDCLEGQSDRSHASSMAPVLTLHHRVACVELSSSSHPTEAGYLAVLLALLDGGVDVVTCGVGRLIAASCFQRGQRGLREGTELGTLWTQGLTEVVHTGQDTQSHCLALNPGRTPTALFLKEQRDGFLLYLGNDPHPSLCQAQSSGATAGPSFPAVSTALYPPAETQAPCPGEE